MDFMKGEDIALAVVEVVNNSSEHGGNKDLDELINLPVPTYFDGDIDQLKNLISGDLFEIQYFNHETTLTGVVSFKLPEGSASHIATGAPF